MPTTIPDTEPASAPRLHVRAPSEAFAVVSCAPDPSRLGEVLSVPPRGTFLFGRGGDLEQDAYPRLSLARVRPGRVERRPPLEIPTLSRQALIVRRLAGGAIELENHGRAHLRVNGLPVDRQIVTPGDAIEVGSNRYELTTE